MQIDQTKTPSKRGRERGVQVHCTLYPNADADIISAINAARGAGLSEKLRTLLRELIELREASAK